MAVPLPFNNPVTVVLIVIAGVVVALATVPANPLADATDTVVTVPEPPPAALIILQPVLVYSYVPSVASV
jgi:hypothetical protein